jgi:hypothetical protein
MLTANLSLTFWRETKADADVAKVLTMNGQLRDATPVPNKKPGE